MPLDPQLADRLAVLPGERFSQAPSDRDLHGRDESPYAAPSPDAVAWPLSTGEVSAIMALGHEHRVPLDPKARRWAAGQAPRGIRDGSKLIEG